MIVVALRWLATLFWLWRVYQETGPFTASAFFFIFIGFEVLARWMSAVTVMLGALGEISGGISEIMQSRWPWLKEKKDA